VSDIDTGVVVSLKVLDPDGRLEKRTNGRCRDMSALCHKRTFALQQKAPSFDQLVGSDEQLVWHCQPERLGGLEVDRQLELGRLHYR